MTKRCSLCGEEKPHGEFYRDSSRSDGVGNRCKPCSRAKAKEWALAHPERVRETSRRYYEQNREALNAKSKAWYEANADRARTASRNWYANNPAGALIQRLRRYGITPEAFDEMLEAQGGSCAACRTTDPGGRWGRWVIDHDHSCCPGFGSCGKCIRGLLCSPCNITLGTARDSRETLLALAEYLDRQC